MLEYGKSGIYNNNRLPAEKKKEEKEKENTRDRSVPDGSDNNATIFIILFLFQPSIRVAQIQGYFQSAFNIYANNTTVHGATMYYQ